MTTYYEYKDSGAQWLGFIPSSWETGVIGSLYALRNTKVSDKDYPPLSVTMRGVLPQLDTVAKTDAHDARKLVLKGDFAINSRSDRRGSCGISDYDGSVSLINTVLQPRGTMNPQYYNWLFHTVQFADEYYKNGHGIVDDLWTTRWDEMKRIVIPVPSKQEQTAIATFLGKKIGEIETIIAEARASIEEYKSWKASIIYEAVTKGLNPNAEMKDSGVEWIGEIPQAWEIKLLSQLAFRVKNNNTGMQENNLLSLSYGKIKRKSINSTDGLLPESFDGYNIINAGDIVLRLTDLQNDHTSLRVGRAEERGIITSAYVTVRPLEENISEYLYYALHSFDVKKGFYGMGSGVRQGLNYSEVRTLKLPFPDARTQHSIVTFIKAKVAKIDSLISEKESLVADLESYKKSLIYEAVTGKRRVC